MHVVAQTLTLDRIDRLHSIARSYVVEGLGARSFEAIPYSEGVVLRAPLCPGGSSTPLIGRENLRTVWWPPLPHLVSGVRVIDSYVNADLNAVTVEFHCDIREPACTLRIIDRFTVDDEGRIVEQENFFDPRDVTNPGWRNAAG
jgi:hypothetical protein